MTAKEKAKWLWDNFPILAACFMYALVGLVCLGQGAYDFCRGEWKQAALSALGAAVGIGGAYGLWFLLRWLRRKAREWTDWLIFKLFGERREDK